MREAGGPLCGDGGCHLGYGVPTGSVIATEDRISPKAVGFDITCGNKAVRLNMPGAGSRANTHRAMDDSWRTLSFGGCCKNRENNASAPFVTDQHPGWTGH